MNIRLVESGYDYNATDRYIDLPSNFVFEDRDISPNINMSGKFFGDGGVQTGNKKIQYRTFSITGRYKAETSQTANEKLNELTAFCYNKKMKLYIIGEATRRYMQGVYWQGVTVTDIVSYNSYIELKLEFGVEYPFWRKDAENTNSFSNVQSGDILTVTNNGSFRAYPEITIENASGSTCPTFKLTRDILCEVDDTNFNDGESIVIDSVAGTVTKNEVNILQNLAGTFLTLQAGSNSITYTGNDGVNITINFREEALY